MPRTPHSAPQPTIRASELGEYSYCSRAWWYRHVIKISPPAGTGQRLSKGIEAHRQHGRQVARASALGTIGLALALLGILAMLIAFLVR